MRTHVTVIIYTVIKTKIISLFRKQKITCIEKTNYFFIIVIQLQETLELRDTIERLTRIHTHTHLCINLHYIHDYLFQDNLFILFNNIFPNIRIYFSFCLYASICSILYLHVRWKSEK